ncbi:MAG: 7,8-dihydroneopterin aldolase/epimerase/oxygenase [Gaiellales bacterium]|nr:7,8-dihydroneopterin aldolase/epimerase/oxygenase [Gaiellales bacterium]
MSGPLIEITGLEVFAHHGVHDYERRDGQPFLIDVRLVGPPAAEQSDRLEDAIDYGAVSDRVVELAHGGPYNLLERLAAVIADDLRERFAASAVTVTVHKPQAPIGHPFRDVSVTVQR